MTSCRSVAGNWRSSSGADGPHCGHGLAQRQCYNVQWQGVGKTAFQLVWCIGGEHNVSAQDVNVFKCGGIYVNQWAFALGAQLARGKMKYCVGYSYNTNPINHHVGSSFSGLPVLQDRISLLQVSETATINQHRLAGGYGREDFLFPGIDLDFLAGALFKAPDDFGPHTSASVAVYYLGLGLTWRYGAAACRECDSIAAASESE